MHLSMKMTTLLWWKQEATSRFPLIDKVKV